MTDKDIKEYNKLIKKLEDQMEKKKEELYGQKENEELAESYKESRRQQKEREENEEYLKEIKDKL